MMRCRPAIRGIALALSVLMTTATVRADSLFGDSTITGNNQYTPPVDHSASEAAREELAEARMSLTRARLATSMAQKMAEKDLRDAGNYRALQINAAQAVSNYNAARRPTLTLLSRDPEYRQLGQQRELLRARMTRVARQKKIDYALLLPLAEGALDVGARMSRAESIVLALDPSVEDARDAMTDAFAALRRVTLDAKQRAAELPAVALARDDVEHARDRVAEANANLAIALKAEADADRSRRQRRNA